VARALVVCALALLAACHGAGTPCGDGYCQTGTVCTADREHCVYPEQRTSCAGLADGTACDIRGIDGACRGDVCLPIACGDGFVQPGEEECDGALLGGHTDCLSLGEGYHQAGSLSCTSDCRLDRTACGDRCGDGIVQAPLEACDVTVGTQTCESAGFHGGTLGCKPDCQLDVSSCDGWCGDGRRTSQEECDGTDFGLTTCNTFGYYAGTLRCTSACKLDQDLCEGECGDGIKNGPEICDRDQLGGLSCQTYGFYGGTLTCGRDCLSVSRAACADFCGDGIRTPREQCDGLDHDGASCTSIGAMAGSFGCDAYCQRTTDTCYWDSPRDLLAPFAHKPLSMWGTSAVDMWVGDHFGAVTRYDGRTWSPVTYLDSAVLAIWWAGGQTWAFTSAGTVYRLDAAPPLRIVTQPRSKGRWATAGNDVWFALGNQVQHYDGSTTTTWSISDDWTGDSTQEIWGTGPHDVWVEGAQSSLHHYDGVHWTRHAPPGVGVEAIWGNGPRDVWVTRGTQLPMDTTTTSLLHYDGMAWGLVDDSPMDSVDRGWFTGDGDLWLLGSSGGEQCLGRRVNGAPTNLRFCASALAPATTWSSRTGDIWFADFQVFRLQGRGWEAAGNSVGDPITAASSWERGSLVVGHNAGVARFLDSAYAPLLETQRVVSSTLAVDDDIWAATVSQASHYRGGSWTHYPDKVGTIAICATSSADVWFGGDELWHYDGHSMNRTIAPAGGVRHIACSPNELWVVTKSSGRVYRRIDGAWSELHIETPDRPANGVLTGASGYTWIWGRSRSYRYDGALREMVDQRVRQAWAVTPRDIWSLDPIKHFDGNTWSAVTSTLSADLITGNRSGEVWIADGDRTYLFDDVFPAPFGGGCEEVSSAYCNVTLRGHTARTVDGPTDCNSVAHPGGELHYKIEVPVTGLLRATVTSRHDIDLSMVRADDRSGCDIASCVGTPISDTKLELEVEQGQTYFLVVGARDGAAPFTLDVVCEKD
jgi:hypothetical protein